MQFAKKEKIAASLLDLTIEERRQLFFQKHLEELIKEYRLYGKPLEQIEAISETIVKRALLEKANLPVKTASIAKTMRAVGFSESLSNLRAWLHGEHPQDKLKQLEI
jgi:hypothetical protein